MNRWWRRLGALLALCAGALALGPAGTAAAHPLGNFTVNHYDGLRLFADRVELLAVVDYAEIPTLQQRPLLDADADGAVSPAEARRRAAAECAAVAAGVAVTVDGVALSWTVQRRRADAAAGRGRAGAPPASSAGCSAPGRAGRAGHRRDHRRLPGRPDRLAGDHRGRRRASGWPRSPVPAARSARSCASYPGDLLTDPLDVRSATLRVEPGTGGGGPGPTLPTVSAVEGWLGRAERVVHRAGRAGRPDRRGRPARGAAGRGARRLARAAARARQDRDGRLPGRSARHPAGRAAGRRDGDRDAHRRGAGARAGAERVHGAGAGRGAERARRAQRAAGRRDRGRAAGRRRCGRAGVVAVAAGSERASAGRAPSGQPGQATGTVTATATATATATGTGTATAMGTGHGHGGRRPVRAGGVGGARASPAGWCPSPTALLVLLGAIGLGRTWFGVGLVLSYGLGMAATLTAAGLLLVGLRDRLDRVRLSDRLRRHTARLVAATPVLTALLVLVVGLGLAAAQPRRLGLSRPRTNASMVDRVAPEGAALSCGDQHRRHRRAVRARSLVRCDSGHIWPLMHKAVILPGSGCGAQLQQRLPGIDRLSHPIRNRTPHSGLHGSRAPRRSG